MKEFLLYKLYMGMLVVIEYIISIIIFIFLLFGVFVMSTNTYTLIVFFCIIGAFYTLFLLNASKIKGKIGEYITQKVIESYCEKRGYRYLYDIMIENEKVKTSQIDHLIITKKGIAVIETKFHSGTIYGSEYNKNWTYIVRDDKNKKHKNSYHNPLMQNYGHIEALKKVIDEDIQFYNIVLYIDNVNLKKCEVSNRFSKVGYTYDLNSIIEQFDLISDKEISKLKSYEIYNKLYYLNIVDKEERKEHILRIRQNKA